MYRMASGATAVLENVWFLPDTTAMQIDERMEIIGTEGSVHIHETHPNFSICDKTGWHSVDTTYWPTFQGRLTGALREELMYFANCVIAGEKPTIITPEGQRRARGRGRLCEWIEHPLGASRKAKSLPGGGKALLAIGRVLGAL